MNTSAHPHVPGRAAAVLAPILAVLLLAGCSGSSQETTAEDTGGGSADSERGAPAEEDAPAEQEQDARDDEENGADLAGEEVDASEREVVHTANLTVETPEIVEAADSAREWVDEAGGHVESENITNESEETPSASLTLRVPSEDYEDALEELGDLGTEANLQRDVSDVTEEVADVDSRVESAEASLDRLRDLLDDAENVDDVLAVESEINTRQQDLEALQARQQALQEDTSFGTIELSLLLPDTYLAEEESESIGFTGGLLRGWRALVSVGEGALVALGWLSPFLAVAAVVASPVVVWYRRRTAARAAATPAAEANSAGTAREPEPVGAREDDSADDSTADGDEGPAPEREA